MSNIIDFYFDFSSPLRSDIETAIARGVFGSPFIIVDNEPFWGFDRFDQLEIFLGKGKI